MTTEKKEKKLTPNGLIALTTTKKALTSAQGFFDAYREYLVNGTIKEVTKPIVDKLDSGELLPTPALEELRNAVFNHVEAVRNSSKEEKGPSAPRTKKAFVAQIFDAATGQMVVKEGKLLTAGFDKPQDAERWVDRRLFEGCSSYYGVIFHHGEKKPWSVIERKDSIARVLKPAKRASVRTVSYGGGSIGFSPKCRESAIRFSRG